MVFTRTSESWCKNTCAARILNLEARRWHRQWQVVLLYVDAWWEENTCATWKQLLQCCTTPIFLQIFEVFMTLTLELNHCSVVPIKLVERCKKDDGVTFLCFFVFSLVQCVSKTLPFLGCSSLWLTFQMYRVFLQLHITECYETGQRNITTKLFERPSDMLPYVFHNIVMN